MKLVSYQQLSVELDKMIFGGALKNSEQAEERADTIEAYLEATGWSWDEILEEMYREAPSQVSTSVCN